MDLSAATPCSEPTAPALPFTPVRAAAVVVGDRLRVVLQGDVDVTAAPVLAGLHDLVARTGLPVEVDAARVTFLDCAGLAAVLALGGPAPGLSLRAASPAVALLLRLTGQLGQPLGIDLDGLVVAAPFGA